MPGLVTVSRRISVGNLGSGEQNGVMLNIKYFIGILNVISSLDKTYIIVRSKVVAHGILLSTEHVGNIEHVKVTNLVCTLVFQEVLKFWT